MRILVKVIIFTLLIIFATISCGNDGGVSSQKRRVAIKYNDFHIYSGSEFGARNITKEKIEELTQGKPGYDVDSLYTSLVRTDYFKGFSDVFRDANNISFEFVGEDGEVLSFIDGTTGRVILSSYEYKRDSLYILQKVGNGQDSLTFVAIRENDGKSFFRTYSAQRYIRYQGVEEEGETENKVVKDTTDVLKKGWVKLNLEKALKFAEIKDSVSMTDPNDVVVWCNVKYIYE